MDGMMMMVGQGDKLTFEDMREEERSIVKALDDAHQSGHDVLKISEIMSANDWDMVEEHDCPESRCDVCASALRLGNSKVRNNLRRLMKYGVIVRPSDGSYALVRETAPQVAAVVVQALPPMVQELPVQCAPRELNDDENAIIRRIRTTDDEKVFKIALKLVEPIKRADCTFYSACLNQAISGDWDGFSCASCTAYAMPDQFQRECDMLALRALQTASDMLDEHGKVNRIRGVKPGADAKRTPSYDE